ncbi:unnamed protein product (macronuclear) [Paramecium tetraurelia]|uniref:Transmembrane protein n=1 Tax=Paramecium tetraurelia TaxID=5888 RepID=A0BHL7_PARTE|nr:uncharacterized protein GSPATT00029069001 [Paramecium tetraurelia]CAK58034.1 unnamed protein product [Paramecium tetraurelia]|eukprot:XP_001425432.1 hypothetical protein (macronuclear) [Paramecium tetraurelia strain d4-2]
MDMKVKLFGGLAATFAASAIYLFFRENNKSLNQKMLDQINKLKNYIENHFYECSKENLSQKLEDRKDFVNLLGEVASNFFDLDRVNDEISRHPYFKKFAGVNQQAHLFNQEYTSFYLRKNSLDAVQNSVNFIVSKHRLINQEQPQLSENASKFINFFYLLLIYLVRLIEETLLDLDDNYALIQMNFLLAGLLDQIELILKQYPLLANLFGIALLGQLQLNDPQVGFGHQCEDNFFNAKIEDTNSNQNCKCLIFDALIRYISLITPILQKKFITILIDHQILSTKDHLVKLGQILLKNQFFLNSQISKVEMYYATDVSVFNHMLIQATAYKEVRQELVKPDLLDLYFLYTERVVAQNNPKFIAKILTSLIASHVMTYPLFGDEDILSQLLNNEKQQTLIVVHFLGMLLILETKDTVDVKENPNVQMLDWLAQNMDFMLAVEVLSYLQKQFILKIFRNKASDIPLLMKQYLQCLRVTHNKRIQQKMAQKKQFDVNAILQQMIGYLTAIQVSELPSKESFTKLISLIPFQDQNEQSNIFSNILRIVFDLPTINFHFLKFVLDKCEKISKESILSYNGYYSHILTAQTVSFDSYMFSIQLSLLFGRPETLIGEISNRMKNDFTNFERYEDFLTRDIILLVDLLENPYYCMNILMQTGSEFPQKQEIMTQLYQYAAISILKLNDQMTLLQLLDTLQLFIHIQELPQYIKELLEDTQDGKVKLKYQYSQNWPYLNLQKDMESVKYFLSKASDPFDELMYAPDSFPFLFEIRQQMYSCESFVKIIELALQSKDRMKLYVWIGKLLYYAKQLLLKKGQTKMEELFALEECKSFIQELSEKEGCNKLVQYLQQ